VDAGERFFDRLEHLKREPGRYHDLLELMYLCMALGFEGRYRVVRNARPTLAERREDLYRLLAIPGSDRLELSPRWQGLALPEASQRWRVPLWVILTGVLAVLLVVHTGFRLRLATEAAQLSTYVQNLPPRAAPSIVSAEVSVPGVEASPISGGQVHARLPYEVLPRIEEVLTAEIQDGIVDGQEDAARVVVRFHDPELFASGSAQLTSRFMPLFERLAHVLKSEPGAVQVVGHSDNVPIRSTRFSSNWELSEARAVTVREILATSGVAPARITVEGRADTEPIASNDTAEGRALNRRIEVLLSKTAEK
jgi:type VI secretion system protein ImpK